MTGKYVKADDRQILVVSDSADELNDIQRLLNWEFGTLLKAHGEEEGLRLFKQHHPALLMLAFQHVEKADRFYLSLYRYDAEIHAVPHQTLLLCRGNESSKAYQLCQDGTINDYVADRPLYDLFRLRLSVAQALNRFDREQYLYLLNSRIDNIVVGLREFDGTIAQMLCAGEWIHQSSVRTFQVFAQTLAIDLERMEENLSNQFDQERRDKRQKERQRMTEELKKTDDWLAQIESEQHARADAAPTAFPDRAIEIMLVDDDEFYRETLVDMLEEAGMHVQPVMDGNAALARLRQAWPQLILLDYNMPGIDGVETLKRIKSNPDTNAIPVIMLTGVSSRDIVTNCISAGAAGFIVKPGDREKILSKIDQVLNKPGD